MSDKKVPNGQKPSLIQPVDDAARQEVQKMIDSARHGALSMVDPGTGEPMVSLVGLAIDDDGRPTFLSSSLSGRNRALEEDGRASLLINQPVRGDPLAQPRLSIYGTVEPVPDEARDHVRTGYLQNHPGAKVYVDFRDMAFWRLEPQRAAYFAGFGRAYRLSKDDLTRRSTGHGESSH